MGGSLKYGQASASLIVGKWSAASRQTTMAAALKEWGMLRRTIHGGSTGDLADSTVAYSAPDAGQSLGGTAVVRQRGESR
jgi:Tn3 transposase DDE domain